MKYKDTPIGKMPDDWNYAKISEVTTLVTDYVANGSFASLAENVKYLEKEDYAVLIRLADYNNNFNGNFVFINEDAYNFLSKSKLYGDEIIISNVGANVGTVFKCPKLKYKMSLAPNSIVVKFNGSDDFYYHWLKGHYGQKVLKSIVTGSAQPKFNKTNFKDMLVPVPPLKTQQKIAKVLSVIDDKIELNNSINNNLEQQAQAIFKSWFIDFDPFGGTMPDSWEEDILGNFIEIKRGGSPRPIQDYISDCGYRWLKISDATAIQSPFILSIKECIKKSGINKTVYLNAGSLVLSNSATPGIPKILDVDSCIHDGWLYFPKSRLSNEYLYLLFKYIRPNLVALGNGSVFTNLKTDILRNYITILPDEETLKVFDNIVKSLFSKILYNTRENQKLTQLRDTLLPKLMSGEIDVSNVDISTDKLSFSEK